MAVRFTSIGVTTAEAVATIEIQRPPNNFFDTVLIREIATALEAADADAGVRSVLLCAQGKAFCAGANFANRREDGTEEGAVPVGGPVQHLYKEAIRLFRTRKPIVAAVQGPAIGGGLGLACVADFRVAAPEARFSANFTRLGFHPGFGLTCTLPRLVGEQQAALLFFTGRRIGGEEAVRIGLADVLVPAEGLRAAALALAVEIAQSSPLGVQTTRETLRRGLADAVERATERELVEQDWLRKTEDFREGIKATAERRLGNFVGR